jgi:hypothetical protein
MQRSATIHTPRDLVDGARKQRCRFDNRIGGGALFVQQYANQIGG